MEELNHNGKKVFISRSPQDTRRIAEEIIRRVRNVFGSERGVVFLLEGELGVGKTTLTKFMVRELRGSDDWVFSPTFTLINEYPGMILHVDLFRVDNTEEIMTFCREKVEEQYTIFFEWGEKVRDELFEKVVRVLIEFGDDDSERRITLTTCRRSNLHPDTPTARDP